MVMEAQKRWQQSTGKEPPTLLTEGARGNAGPQGGMWAALGLAFNDADMIPRY